MMRYSSRHACVTVKLGRLMLVVRATRSTYEVQAQVDQATIIGNAQSGLGCTNYGFIWAKIELIRTNFHIVRPL